MPSTWSAIRGRLRHRPCKADRDAEMQKCMKAKEKEDYRREERRNAMYTRAVLQAATAYGHGSCDRVNSIDTFFENQPGACIDWKFPGPSSVHLTLRQLMDQEPIAPHQRLPVFRSDLEEYCLTALEQWKMAAVVESGCIPTAPSSLPSLYSSISEDSSSNLHFCISDGWSEKQKTQADEDFKLMLQSMQFQPWDILMTPGSDWAGPKLKEAQRRARQSSKPTRLDC